METQHRVSFTKMKNTMRNSLKFPTLAYYFQLFEILKEFQLKYTPSIFKPVSCYSCQISLHAHSVLDLVLLNIVHQVTENSSPLFDVFVYQVSEC